MSLPHRLNLALDEDEVKVLLLWAHAASEFGWEHQLTAQKMQDLSDRIQYAIERQMPHLRDFKKEKEFEIERFVASPESDRQSKFYSF